MKILVKTKDLSREEWLEYRRKGVCGSDASVILGINQYRSVFELWEDKTGISKKNESGNEYTHFGHIMEPVIIREFQQRTGLKVRRKNCMLKSEEYPFMLANVDGIVKEPDGSLSIFEAKTASEYKRDVWENGVPEEYIAQTQHYMAVTGYKKAYIAAVVGGNSYYCHEVERDDRYIKKLIRKEAEFWNCVVHGIEPKADSSPATKNYLEEKYAKSDSTEIILPAGSEKLIKDYLYLKEQIKQLSERKDGISNIIKSIMKEHEVGRIGSNKVVWNTIRRKSPDDKKLREYFGDNYEDYLTETSYRRLSVV